MLKALALSTSWKSKQTTNGPKFIEQLKSFDIAELVIELKPGTPDLEVSQGIRYIQENF
jgi:hypothetical protein